MRKRNEEILLKKLFVGSLAWATTDDSLREHFATCGNVASAKVIVDRDSGRSKGFGFVEFEDDNEADAAISKLNGSDLDGRTIAVNEARPREENSDRRSNGGGNRRSW